MRNILFLHTNGVPIVMETFMGLGSEWWSVIVTLFTGISAFFVALAVFTYTKTKERRLTRNYKIRIARLLYQLHRYFVLFIDSVDLNGAETFFSQAGIRSLSNDLNSICDKLDDYIDHIIDRLSYKRLDGIEKTIDWIRGLLNDTQHKKSMYLIFYNDPKEKLIIDLTEHRNEIVKFLKYLNIGLYIDNAFFSELVREERPAGSTCPAGQQGEKQ